MRLFIFILVLFAKISFSQNLVNNSGFDIYINCPSTSGDLNTVLPWIKSIGTPDYFNMCFSNPNVSVPKNLNGYNYQVPHSNVAYAGFSTVYLPSVNTRENISAPLSMLLTLNSYYLVKYYISTAQAYKLATNNIALCFSSTLTTSVNAGNTVSLPMHIYKFGNPVIKDTLNWTEIMGVYKANGTEQYITIGNFKADSSTKIDTINNTMFTYAAYYFIDDVSVEPICTPFWSYRDTTVAIGDSVLIGPAITGLNINWYDATSTLITNAPGIYVKPAQTTTYTAVEDFCGNTYTNTIVVTVTPTAVKEYEKDILKVELYPNPTSDKFSVVTELEDAQLSIEILDVQGKIIFKETGTVVNYETTVRVNLSNGVYVVSITNIANGNKTIKKLVVQK